MYFLLHSVPLDPCKMLHTGPLKPLFFFFQIEVWHFIFPLCSSLSFHLCQFCCVFSLSLSSQCRTCGAVIAAGWLARSPQLKLLVFGFFLLHSLSAPSHTSSSPFLCLVSFVFFPALVVMSVSRLLRFLSPSTYSFSSSPLLPFSVSSHSFPSFSSLATCSRQWFAPDMPRHVRTHAECRQTET